jgi:hypothetical protein
MSKTLDQRLQSAKAALDQVQEALIKKPGSFSVDVETKFKQLVEYRTDIEYWRRLIEARATARHLLDGLEAKADPEDLVPYGDTRAKFEHVRFLGVQSYLATNWALADRVTGMAGRILCTADSGFNLANPAQLVSHFFQKDRKKIVAGVLHDSLRSAFGWPVGLSYGLRNHFIHDGGQMAASDFFEGRAAVSAFRISSDGWARVLERAQDVYGLDPSLHRVGKAWPVNPRDDLRPVLDVFEREMDDALGVIVGSASHFLHVHVGFMLGDD